MIDWEQVEKEIRNKLNDWESVKRSHLSLFIAAELTEYIKEIVEKNNKQPGI